MNFMDFMTLWLLPVRRWWGMIYGRIEFNSLVVVVVINQHYNTNENKSSEYLWLRIVIIWLLIQSNYLCKQCATMTNCASLAPRRGKSPISKTSSPNTEQVSFNANLSILITWSFNGNERNKHNLQIRLWVRYIRCCCCCHCREHLLPLTPSSTHESVFLVSHIHKNNKLQFQWNIFSERFWR
jgi:hypothetical protein